MPSLRLGYYYHIPVKEEDGTIKTLGVQGRFIDSLAAHCEEVICFLHRPGKRDHYHFDYGIRRSNVRLADLGIKQNSPRRTFCPGSLEQVAKRHMSGLDALLVRGPSPLLPPLCRWARGAGVMPVLLIVGNYVDGIEDLRQPLWRKTLIGAYLRTYNLMQKREVKKCLSFVNSNKLYNEFVQYGGRVVETRTTTLDDNDFFERNDTCLGETVRILYVGRYDQAKGLKLLVSSLAGLVGKGYRCELHFAGWDTSEGGMMEELLDQANSLGVGHLVTDHGFKPVGEELWSIYRDADIFVNASQASEGFPRTIWEAMANSVPVVATDVGSVRAFTEGVVEIVAPRDQDALTAGIERVIKDGASRRMMISKGFELAGKNTLPARARELVSGIEEYLRRNKGKKKRP
ncbi:MAG TPA: glycosyltransferase family 4 protein [Acidobacteriota bacterium]|nr:glycosyltransferase family 4 protein [Acidobacteriota bacterium]